MKTKGFLFAVISVVVVCGMSGAASAGFYLNFVDQDGGAAGYGENTLISPYALAPGSLIETFNGVVPSSYPTTPISAYDGIGGALDQDGWTWGPGVENTYENDAVALDSSTYAAAPWSRFTRARDATPYATIPYDNTGGTPTPRQASVSFGADYRYLGLHWGSMDPEVGTWSQNIFLYNDGQLVETVFAPLPKNGGQEESDTNKYVNIFLTGGEVFDTAVFQSNQYAFEFDNLAVGTVPVPGAILLGFLGLGAAGLKLRRFA